MKIPVTEGGMGSARGPAMAEVQVGGQRTAAALGRAADTAGQIAGDLIRAETEQKDAADRLTAGKSLIDYRDALNTLHDGVRDSLRDGTLASEDDARAAYEDGLSAIDAVELPNIGQRVKQDLQLSLAETKQKASFGFDEVLRGWRGDQVQKTTMASLDAIGRQAVAPGANMAAIEAQIDATVGTAAKASTNIDPAWLDAQRRGAKDAAWTNNVARRIELGENSMKELQAVEHDLIAADGKYAGKLQGDNSNALLARVRSAKDRLTARWEQAAAKRDANAKRMLDTYQQVYSSGFPVGDKLREQVRQATKGTEYEQAFNDAMADESAVGEMLKRPVADQQQYIVTRERELRTGKVNDPKEIRRFNALANAFNQNIKSMSESPMEWNETRLGQPAPRLSASLLLSADGVDAAAGVLRDRVATLDAMSKQTGVPMSAPLFKEEADQIGGIIKSQTPTERAKTLGVLANAIDDPAVYKAAVKQMLGDDPRAYAAGLAHGLGYTTTEGRSVGAMIEQGSVILRDKSVIVPKAGSADDGTKAAFNEYITTDMMPAGGSARDTYYQASLAIYAKLAADEVKLGRTLDTKLFQRAVRIAVGGVVSYYGQDVIAPRYGMSDDEFTTKMDSALDTAARRAGVDYNLSDMRLVASDTVPGRYFVMEDPIHPFVDKAGKPIFVEVK